MCGFTTTLTGTTFDQALTKTLAALKAEGFEMLSDINIQHAMKVQPGVDMPPNRSLGAEARLFKRPFSFPMAPRTRQNTAPGGA